VANSTKPIVIKFEAKWCQPCKAMTPIVLEVEKEFAGKIDF
jgi:thioredoxin 1